MQCNEHNRKPALRFNQEVDKTVIRQSSHANNPNYGQPRTEAALDHVSGSFCSKPTAVR